MSKLNLDLVKKNFEQWRANKNGKGKIPEQLWKQVLQLLDRYPIGKITSNLSISSRQINKKRGEISKKTVSATKFVEMPITSVQSLTSDNLSSVNIKRNDGTKIVIENLPEQTLINILTQFTQAV